jgi:hypothetical protein
MHDLKLRRKGGAVTVPRIRSFASSPVVRCCQLEQASPSTICGEVATFERVHSELGYSRFFCGQHRQDGDIPITDGAIVPIVQVTCQVSIAGSSTAVEEAEAGALTRLEAAARAAGVVLRVHHVDSGLARFYPSIARAVRPGGTG